MESIQIRRSIYSDFNSCKNLLARNKLPAEFSLNLYHYFFIAESPNHELVAVIGLEFEEKIGLLRSLAVNSTSRGLGTEKLLVKTVEDYARSQSICELFLLTTTANIFFQNAGYTVFPKENVPAFIRQTTEFSFICPESSICMHKIIV